MIGKNLKFKRLFIFLCITFCTFMLFGDNLKAVYFYNNNNECAKYSLSLNSSGYFCIEAGVEYYKYADYYDCTDEYSFSCEEEYYAYYGFTNKSDMTKVYKAQSLLNGREFYTSKSNYLTCTNKLSTEDLEEKAYDYCYGTVSFKNTLATTPITAGQSVTYTDANSVLSGFSVSTSSPYISLNKNSNKLTITANSNFTGDSVTANILLSKGYENTYSVRCHDYENDDDYPESQNYMMPNGKAPYVSDYLTVRVVKAVEPEEPEPEEPEKVYISIMKRDKDTGAPLSGAKYRIGTSLKSDGSINANICGSCVSGADGYLLRNQEFTVEDTIYYQEVEAPSGYSMDKAIKRENLSNISGNKTFYVADEKLPLETATIKIYKVDTNTNAKLAGAKYKVGTSTDSSGNVAGNSIYTSDQDGLFYEGIHEIGTTIYYQEVEAPSGYYLNDNVFSKKLTSSDKDKTLSLYVDNIKIRTVKIYKYDGDTYDIPVAGAKYLVGTEKDSEGNVIGNVYTSDENGLIYSGNAKEGDTWWAQEIEAPIGYQLGPRVGFRIIPGPFDEIDHIFGVFDYKFRTIKIYKKDAETGNPLKGAEYKVGTSLDSSGNVIGNTYTSDENGLLFSNNEVNNGETYYYQEIKAPDGYKIDSSVRKVKATADKVDYIINTYDVKQKQFAFIIRKIDQFNNGISGIRIKYAYGNKENLKGSLNDYENGYFIKTTAENDGTLPITINEDDYLNGIRTVYYQEIKDANLHSDTEAGKYVYDSTIKSYEFKLTSIKKFKTLKKYGSDNYYFTLEECENDIADHWQSMGSFSTLDEAQDFYKCNTLTIKEDDGLPIETVDFLNHKNVYYKFSILKKDKNSGKAIKNVEFTLYKATYDKTSKKYTKEDKIKKYITDENGYITEEELKEGSYCVVETSAPSGYVIDKTPTCFTLNEENKKQVMEFTNEFVNPKTGPLNTKLIISICTTTILLGYVVLKKKQKFI